MEPELCCILQELRFKIKRKNITLIIYTGLSDQNYCVRPIGQVTEPIDFTYSSFDCGSFKDPRMQNKKKKILQ